MTYDLQLDNNNDIILEGNELKTIQDAPLVAQDVKRSLLAPIGSLPWDTTQGSHLLTAVNVPADNDIIQTELLRITQSDARIDQESITIHYNKHKQPIVQFTVLGDNTIQEVQING